LPDDATADQYFDLLFPQTLSNMLVTETTRYCEQKGKPFEQTSHAEMKAFVGCEQKGKPFEQTSHAEMKAFVGLILQIQYVS